MSIVTTIVTPIITTVFIGGFLLWILFMIYKGVSKSFPNFKFFMKYSIFRKKFNEKVVEWCMDAITKDMSNIDAEKFLLMKGIKPNRIKETMYIYDKVLNEMMKGGYQNNEQLRQSNEQTELPKTS